MRTVRVQFSIETQLQNFEENIHLKDKYIYVVALRSDSLASTVIRSAAR